jgi:Ser/Thr protein kinase RdoA (MazF antagonist)
MTVESSGPTEAAGVVDLTPPTVATLVERHYDVEVDRVTPLGAESSAVCEVRLADGRALAMKIFWRDAGSSAAVIWQHGVVSRLADAGHPVARPIRSREGALTEEAETGGRRVLMQASEWLTGTPLEDAQVSSTLLHEIGRTAARLHLDLQREAAPPDLPGHAWEITRSRATIEASLERLRRDSSPNARLVSLAERVVGILRSEVEPVLGGLPRAVVHHDLHDSNLLVGPSPRATAVVGILDFGDMLESVRVSEPVIAAAYAARNSRDPLAALHAVMAGWAETVPLTTDEAAVALPLAAARLTANAAVWTSRLGTTRGFYAMARMHGSIDTAEEILGHLA